MRVGVDDSTLIHQATGCRERLANRFCRAEHVRSGEQRHPGKIRAVIGDGFRNTNAVRAAQREIVLAMRRRLVHEAGALVGGDEIAGEQRHVEIVALAAQRMRTKHAGELCAGMHVQHVMQGDAGIF